MSPADELLVMGAALDRLIDEINAGRPGSAEAVAALNTIEGLVPGFSAALVEAYSSPPEPLPPACGFSEDGEPMFDARAIAQHLGLPPDDFEAFVRTEHLAGRTSIVPLAEVHRPC